MSKSEEMLEIVNEEDQVIGLETRQKVHEQGLLHREIHIWFFTPNKEIIFQHRAKDKDTYPDLLDATVGGHVDSNMTYEETFVKECEEETGLKLNVNDGVYLRKMRKNVYDEVTHKTNNTIRIQYAYLYKGKVGDLQIEEGKSQGFVAISLNKIKSLNEDEAKKFIPSIIKPDFIELYDLAIEKLNL